MLLLCCLLHLVFENIYERPLTRYQLKSCASEHEVRLHACHRADSTISTRRDLRSGSIRRRVIPSALLKVAYLLQCAPVFESLSKKLLLQNTDDYTRLSTINLLLRTCPLAAIWSHLPPNFSLFFCHPRHRLPSVLALTQTRRAQMRPDCAVHSGVRTSRQGGHQGLCPYCLELSSTYGPASHANSE